MRRRRPARDLRTAIDCLPLHTREAMLEGISAGRIIVGAYTDRQGGVCPMLAAHRNGGRTSLASFARAWDRYTGARRARAATPRELNTLRAMLEASIEMEQPSLHDVPRPQPAAEPSYPVGWAWLRPVTSFDDYASALAALDLAVARPDELELGHDAVARGAQ
jgi:hypothetical protein